MHPLIKGQVELFYCEKERTNIARSWKNENKCFFLHALSRITTSSLKKKTKIKTQSVQSFIVNPDIFYYELK